MEAMETDDNIQPPKKSLSHEFVWIGKPRDVAEDLSATRPCAIMNFAAVPVGANLSERARAFVQNPKLEAVTGEVCNVVASGFDKPAFRAYISDLIRIAHERNGVWDAKLPHKDVVTFLATQREVNLLSERHDEGRFLMIVKNSKKDLDAYVRHMLDAQEGNLVERPYLNA